jgi:hypothetical protein
MEKQVFFWPIRLGAASVLPEHGDKGSEREADASKSGITEGLGERRAFFE